MPHLNEAPVITIGGPNLISNSSFEGGVAGWTSNNGLERTNSPANYDISGVADGSYFMEVEGNNGTPGVPSYIETATTTVVGQTYEFNLSAVTRVGSFNVGDIFSVNVNGVEIGRFTTGMAWADYSVRFTATSTSTTLRISSQGSLAGYTSASDGVGLLVDNARLYAISSSPAAYTENGNPVVLNASATVTDPELSAANNFNGATLTLARNAGASSDDVFSATGTLAALTQGGNLVVGTTTIGTVTTNSAGTLVLTFNASATSTRVNAAMRQIAYSNSSDTPPANVQINWTFNDGNTGGQGTGGALSGTGSTTVNITPVNDAPTAIAIGGGANLVSNGSFETLSAQGPNVAPAGWSVSGGAGAYADATRSSDGSRLVAFHGWGTGIGGALSQTIATVAGQTYVLSFDMGEHIGNTNANTANLLVQAISGATTVLSATATDLTAQISTATKQGYNTYTYTFTATAATTLISFTDQSVLPNGNTDLDFDNVRVWNAAPSAAENAANGTFVGTAVGIDPEGMLGLTYSLTDSAGGRFAIDSTTGAITVANGSLLNYQAATSHNITVRATDSGGLSFDKVVAVGVTNVNKAPVLQILMPPSANLAMTFDSSAGLNLSTAGGSVTTTIGTLTSVTDAQRGAVVQLGLDGTFVFNSDSQPNLSGEWTLSSRFKDLRFETGTWLNLFSGVTNDPLTINPTTKELGYVDGGGHFISTGYNTTGLDDGNWHTATVVRTTAGTLTYYIDGTAVGTVNNATSAVRLLEYGSYAALFPFAQYLDDFQYFNHAITAQEAAAVHAGSSLPYTENGSPVVLNAGATVTDPELSAANNFNGATLTLARNAGASSDDVFSATGTLAALTQGGNLVVGGTTIGTVTTNSAGTLVLTFNASATSTLVNSAMRQIAYRNSSENPPASAQINWTFNDGNTGGQGTGGALSGTGSTTVNITPFNDAAVIAGTSTGTVVEDGGVSNGTAGTPTVSGTLTSTDVDNPPANTFTAVNTATASAGGYGTYIMTAGGVWTYTLNNSNAAVQALNVVNTLSDTFTVTSIDGTQKVVTVTINGANDAPTAIAIGGGANLVSNGSFETQSGQGPNVAPTGWSVSGGAGGFVNANRSSDGSAVVAFHGWSAGSGGVLSQTIATVAGQTYVLSFDMGEHGSNTNANTANLLVQAISGGATVLSATATDPTAQTVAATKQGYNTYTYTFTATAATTLISFTDQSVLANGYTDLDFDNVRVWNAAPSAAENAANGTFVGTAVGIDPEGMLGLTYSLTDSAGGRFAIDSTTGAITVANGSLLNYEAATSHNITVRATDTGGLSFDKVVAIGVTNLNEAPVLQMPPSANLAMTFDSSAGLNMSTAGVSVTTTIGTLTSVTDAQRGAVVQTDTNGMFVFDAEDRPDLSGEWTLSSRFKNLRFETGKWLSLFRSESEWQLEIHSFTHELGYWDAATNSFKSTGYNMTGLNDGNWHTATVVRKNDGTRTYYIDGTAVGAVNATASAGALMLYGNGHAAGAYPFAQYLDDFQYFNRAITAQEAAAVHGSGVAAYTENGSPVVLNAGATVTDPELSAANNFNGAALTLARNAGASSDDVFSATGTLAALTQGGNLVVGGTTIGTVTTNSAGTLVLTFNASATSTLVNSAMRQIAYRNTSNTPPASVQINWTFNDGNTGGQGTGGALSGTGSTTVNITPFNDAAVIAGTSTGTVVEDGGVSNGIAGTPTFSGTLTSTDVDNPPNSFTAVDTATASTGGYGTYTMTAGGTWTYALNNSNAAVQALKAGTALSDTFTVTSIDGTQKVVTVTINGANDAPTAIAIGGGANLVSNGSFETPSAQGWSVSGGTGAFVDANRSSDGSGVIAFHGWGTGSGGVLGQTIATVAGQTYVLSFDMGEHGSNTNANTANLLVQAISGGATVLSATATDPTAQTVAATKQGYNTYTYTFTATAATTLISFTDQSVLANGYTDLDFDNVRVWNAAPSAAENAANGTFVGTAVGIDPEGMLGLTYSLTDSAGGRFAINSTTGAITVANGSLLNYEAATSHNITVRATDSGGLSFDKVVAIGVTNVNEAPVITISGSSPAAYIEKGGSVVLDASATVTDPELSAANNYNSATLTLARNAGASSQDVFSATGTLAALTQGGNLVVGATTIGTVTTNSAGTLVLTFNASATSTLVNSAMRQITYRNSSDNPPANVQINWTFNDGNTGGQGTGGALSATGSTTVNITPVNDAAVIAGISTGTVVEAGGASNGIAGTPTFSGTLTSTDVDNPPNSFTAVDTATASTGGYGTYTMTAGGTWTYALNNSNAAVQALKAGTALSDTFTVTSIDGTQKVVTVTINGANDAPTVSQITGAVAAYNFENGAGNAPSTVAGGPAMTVGGSVAYSTSAGRFGGSTGLLFNTAANSATAPVTLSAIPIVAAANPQFSFGAWVRFDQTDNWGRVFDFGTGQANNNLALARRGITSQLTIATYNGSGQPTGSFIGGNIVNGTWMHVAVTVNAANLVTLYINGVSAGSYTATAPINYAAWTNNRIGASNWSSDALFRGAMDDIAIFDRALNADEVVSLASTTTAPSIINKTIVENAANGTNIFAARSSDVDAGDGVTYSIVSGNTNNTFAINTTTGQVTVADSTRLNFEATSSYSLVIRATDTAGATTNQTVLVNVANVNEVPVVTLGGPNLISNPSFEGGVAGWTSNTGLERTNSTQAYGISGVADGSYFMEVEGNSGMPGVPSYIETTATTVVGQTYEFSLSAVTRVGTNVGDMFSVNANGVEIGRFTTGTAWADYTIRFTATTTSTTLRINSQGSVSGYTSASDGVGLLVDNARLYAISSSPAAYTENGNPVVLNASATVTDPELSAANNYNGATLTLARNAGASSDDVFSATGTLTALTQGHSLVVGGANIGTVTTNSAGTLVLTFNASATSTRVNAVMRQIAYSNSSDTPAASAQINWTFNDGNTGGQGPGGALSGTGSTTVNITPFNDPAVIAGTKIGTVVEDGGVNNGTAGTRTVSGTLSMTDVDNVVVPANSFTAVGTTASTGGYGTYTMTAAGAWTYALNNSNAAVQGLNAGASLTDTFTVTAIDGTPQVITITVNGANDAPVGQNVSTAMNEDMYFRLEATYVNREFGTQAGHPVDALRIDNIPLPGVGKLTYGVNNQVVDAGHNILSDAELQTLRFTPNLFPPSLFGLTDVDTGDTLGGVRINTLPNAQTQGQLILNGQAVVAGTTIAAANLSNLTFVPVQYFNGLVTFGFTVQDAHGAYAAAANTATIAVAAINNRPRIEAPLVSFTYSGGGAHGQGSLLTGIQFADADSGSSDVTVTLSIVGGGRLEASAQSGVVVNTSSDGHTLTLTGSIQNINNLVHRTEGVQYTAAQGGVRFIAPDIANPRHTATATLLTDGRVSLVTTTDSGVLRADESLIPVDASGVKLITVTGQHTSTLTLIGQQSQIDRYINTLHGVVNDHVAYLSTVMNDHGNTGMDSGLTGSPTDERAGMLTSIVIQPLNELPKPNIAPAADTGAGGVAVGTVAVGGIVAAAAIELQPLVGAAAVQSVAAAIEAAAAAVDAAAAAADAAAAALEALGEAEAALAEFAVLEALAEAALEAAAAARAAAAVAAAALEAIAAAEVVAAEAATAAAIAGALAVGVLVAVGIAALAVGIGLLVEATQGAKTGGGGTGNHPNRAPVITRPDQLPLLEDAQGFRLTAISIADDCAATDTIQVTFSVSAGTLTADLSNSGISLQADSTATKLILRGPIENINKLLTTGAGVRYTPAANANDALNGPVTLSIDANDLGHGGTGGALTDHKTTTLHVIHVIDAVGGTYTQSADYRAAKTPVTIGHAFALADIHGVNLNQLVLHLSNRKVGDTFAFDGQTPAGITVTFTSPDTLTIAGVATVAAYQALLSHISFFNTLPNPDTTGRQFTLTARDEQGTPSAPASTTLAVVSPLSTRIAEFDAAQAASSSAIQSSAATVVTPMLHLMVARNNLAQEVHNVLVFSKEQSADLLQVGNSLQDALDKLGIHASYATGTLTQTDSSLLATTATVLYQQDTGGLLMSDDTQAVLLSAVNQAISETRQDWYRELTHWLDAGVQKTDSNGNVSYLWAGTSADAATANAAMAALVGRLYTGTNTVIPGITHTANPALPLPLSGTEYLPEEGQTQGEPGALATYVSGALTLTATQKQDVQQHVDLVRLIATNPGATHAQLALMALALVPTYPGADHLYRADQLLEALLTNAGIAHTAHTLNTTQQAYLPAGHATPATLTNGGVAEWTTVDGQLVFDNATRTALIEQLSDKITLDARQLQALQGALQTNRADATTGQYTVTQSMLDLLATLGVYAAPTVAGGTLLSADMRDRVVAQLVALGPLQVSTDGLALSADLLALTKFNTAKNAAPVTFNGATFKAMAATPEVVQLLQNMGITIDSVQRYAEMGMQSVLEARVLAGKDNGSTTVYRNTVRDATTGAITSDDLYLPEPVFNTAYNLLSLEYSQNGLTTDTAYPLQTSYTAPTVSGAPQALVDATQPSPLWDVLDAISHTSFVIQELLGVDTTTPNVVVGTGSTPNALKLGMGWQFFEQSLADAGLALVNLGSIADSWTTAKQAQFNTAGAFAYTAEGELVMSAAAVTQLLGHTALAKYFEQRSELAHHAFGLLTRPEASNGVVVVNGAATTTLSRQSAAVLGTAIAGNANSMGLVAVSTAALLELQKLGAALPAITARGTQFTQAQIDAVKTTPVTMLLDEAGDTYWMRSETRDGLLVGAARVLQSSLQLANLLDRTHNPADTADMVNKALAAKAVLVTADASNQVETLILTTAQLTALHLVFTVGTDAALVSTAELGTVFVVPGGTKLTMSSATKNWLRHQASAVAAATFTPATNATLVAQLFIAANQRLQILDGALTLGDDQPVIIHANADFKAWIQGQSSAAQQLGNFSDLTHPAGQAALTKEQIQALFTTAGSYAIDGDDIRTSLATFKLWQAAGAQAAAVAGKGDLFTPASLDALLSAAPPANTTNAAAKFAAQAALDTAKAATQTAAFASTPVAGTVHDAFVDQITLQDTQLEAMQKELLAQPVPNWAVASTTAGTGGGYGFLISKETLALLGQIEPKLQELGIDDLGTTSAGDHIISADTRLMLLAHLAGVRETYSPVLGRAVHTNATSVSLLSTLSAAEKLVDQDGLVTLDGANAALLAGAVMKLGAANSYVNTALGHQQLLHAALGTVQVDGAGKLHMSLDTLRLLQAEVSGWAEGAAAPAMLLPGQLMSAVEINRMMDVAAKVANHTRLFDGIPGLRVSNALLPHAARLGITLHLIDNTNPSAIASALSDGSGMQLGAYTVLGSDIVISTDTVAWLEKITQARVQDTLGALNLSSQLPTINPLTRWTAEPETLMAQLQESRIIFNTLLDTVGGKGAVPDTGLLQVNAADLPANVVDSLTSVSPLKVFTKAEEDAAATAVAVPGTPLALPTHIVSWETLQSAETAYHVALDAAILATPDIDPSTIDFGVLTVSDTSSTVYSVESLHSAYLSLQGGDNAYVKDAAGNFIMPGGVRNRVLERVATHIETLQHDAARDLIGMLGTANTQITVTSGADFRQLLGQLLVTPYYTSNTAEVNLDHALVYNAAADTYTMSAATRRYLLSQAQHKLAMQNDDAIQGAVNDLNNAYGVNSLADFIESNNQWVYGDAPLLAHAADDNNAATSPEADKYVVALKFDASLYAALTGTGGVFATTSPSTLGGSAATKYDSLYTKGNIAVDTTTDPAKPVIYMSLETYADKLGQLPANAASNLVCVNEADFADKLNQNHDWVSYRLVTSLNGQSAFNDNLSLSAALNAQPEGTIFKDSRGMYWMSNQTATVLGTALDAALSADDFAVGLSTAEALPTVSSTLLAAFTSDIAPTANATHYKAYALTAAQVTELHDVLGIHLTQAPSTVEPWQAPPLSTYVVDSTSGQTWVSAETFQFLGAQLNGMNAWNQAVDSAHAAGHGRRLGTTSPEDVLKSINATLDRDTVFNTTLTDLAALNRNTTTGNLTEDIYKITDQTLIGKILSAAHMNVGLTSSSAISDLTWQDVQRLELPNYQQNGTVLTDVNSTVLYVGAEMLNELKTNSSYAANITTLDLSTLENQVVSFPELVSFNSTPALLSVMDLLGYHAQNVSDIGELTNQERLDLNNTQNKLYYLDPQNQVIMSKETNATLESKIVAEKGNNTATVKDDLWTVMGDGLLLNATDDAVRLNVDKTLFQRILNFISGNQTLTEPVSDYAGLVAYNGTAAGGHPYFESSGPNGSATTILAEDYLAMLKWVYENRGDTTKIPFGYGNPSIARPLYSFSTGAASFLPALGNLVGNTVYAYLTGGMPKGTPEGTLNPLRLSILNNHLMTLVRKIRRGDVERLNAEWQGLPMGEEPGQELVVIHQHNNLNERLNDDVPHWMREAMELDRAVAIDMAGNMALPYSSARTPRTYSDPLFLSINAVDTKARLLAPQSPSFWERLASLVSRDVGTKWASGAGEFKKANIAGRAWWSFFSIGDEIILHQQANAATGEQAVYKREQALAIFFSAFQLITAGLEQAVKNPHNFGTNGQRANFLLFNLPGYAKDYFALYNTPMKITWYEHMFMPAWSVVKNGLQAVAAIPRAIGYLARKKTPEQQIMYLAMDAQIRAEFNQRGANFYEAIRSFTPPIQKLGVDDVKYAAQVKTARGALNQLRFELFLEQLKVGSWQVANYYALKGQWQTYIDAVLRQDAVSDELKQLQNILRNWLEAPVHDANYIFLQQTVANLTIHESNEAIYVNSALTKFVALIGVALNDFVDIEPIQWAILGLGGPRAIYVLRSLKAILSPASWALLTYGNFELLALDETLQPDRIRDEKTAVHWSFFSLYGIQPIVSAFTKKVAGHLRDVQNPRYKGPAKVLSYAVAFGGAIGTAVLMQFFPLRSESRLMRNYAGVLPDAVGAHRRLLGAAGDFSAFQQGVLADASLTSTASSQVLQFAKDAGFDRNYYEIDGYFSSGDGGEVFYGALAYHVQDGELSIAGLVTQNGNSAPIRMRLSNTTGELAIYFIYTEDANTSNPYIDVDVSESSESSTNNFIVANKHAIIHGGDSLEIYHLFQALETVANPTDAAQALAGYIVDGFGANDGSDLVTFDLAESGQTIHADIGYNGLVSYQGIYNFAGSAFNDIFTRYTSAQDDAWVSYVGGGGTDVFDLRAGNNSVMLSGGVVRLDSLATPATMYFNHITATNENGVSLVVSDDASQWFEVYGNALSSDSVWVAATEPDQGVDLSNYVGNPAAVALPGTTTNWGVHDGYVLSRYINGAADSLFGFFDTNIEAFYGSLFADHISLDATSTLKVVDGMDGADTIDVNVAGIEVTGGGANSLVSLGSGATNATVYANAGNAIRVNGASGVTVHAQDNDTDVATSVDLQHAATATVNAGLGSQIAVNQATGQTATVNIDWLGADDDFAGELFEVLPDDAGVTTVTADATSAGTLAVNANDGYAKLQMGGQAQPATQVHVGTEMDNLWVIADQAHALFLDLYFDNPDVADTVADLQSLAGVGHLDKSATQDATTGMYTFSGAWKHGDTSTQLSLSFADAAKVNLHFGSNAPVTLASIVG